MSNTSNHHHYEAVDVPNASSPSLTHLRPLGVCGAKTRDELGAIKPAIVCDYGRQLPKRPRKRLHSKRLLP